MQPPPPGLPSCPLLVYTHLKPLLNRGGWGTGCVAAGLWPLQTKRVPSELTFWTLTQDGSAGRALGGG